MKLLKILLAMIAMATLVNCGKANFSSGSSNGSATGINNDGGSDITEQNGTLTGNANNGSQINVLTAYGTQNGQPVGQPVVVQVPPLNVTCGEWIMVSDLYNVRMRNLQEAVAPLPPRAEDYPRERSGISATDATLNRVCEELGCGPALAAYTREYSSPHNNSIVRWAGDRWLKVLASESNFKIDHKGPRDEGLLCDAPGAQPPARIEKYHTD